MPPGHTTHKDLHRAALGSVFSLVYLVAISPSDAENQAHTAPASPMAQSSSAKLVKNEPAKVPASAVSHKPSVQPIAQQRVAIPVPQVEAPSVKGGKLRAIPLSTLNPEKATAESAKDTADTKAAKETKITKDTKDTNSKPSQSKPAKTATAAKRMNSSTAARLNNGLVPPPPAIVPIGMDALGMYAQPVDYLSLKELEGRKRELTARLNELDSTVTDAERQIRERKERAELFESLYQEGVVSRKELETAKREAGEINRDLKFKQEELESVKISMKAVNNRLAVLKKMEEKLNAGKKNPSPKPAKKK